MDNMHETSVAVKQKTRKNKQTAIHKTAKKNSLGKRIYRDRFLYLLLIPFIIWLLVFSYRPLMGLQIAFQDYSLFKGIGGSDWVGLANFKEFFEGAYFWRTLRNTLMISVYSIIFGFPAPIILALMLNQLRNAKYKKVIQTLTYLPYFISVVVVAGIVVNFLAPERGIVNIIIKALGGKSTYFLTKPEYFRTIYTLMNIWKDTGFGAIVYLAALSGVDVQLYDACKIDGGNEFQQILHVTLPSIVPTIVIMFIMRIGGILDVGYESIILLYQPVTYETADVISTYVYRLGIEGNQQAMATAVGFFNAVVAFILVTLTNTISRKVSDISLW